MPKLTEEEYNKISKKNAGQKVSLINHTKKQSREKGLEL